MKGGNKEEGVGCWGVLLVVSHKGIRICWGAGGKILSKDARLTFPSSSQWRQEDKGRGFGVLVWFFFGGAKNEWRSLVF